MRVLLLALMLTVAASPAHGRSFVNFGAPVFPYPYEVKDYYHPPPAPENDPTPRVYYRPAGYGQVVKEVYVKGKLVERTIVPQGDQLDSRY